MGSFSISKNLAFTLLIFLIFNIGSSSGNKYCCCPKNIGDAAT